MLLRKSFWLTNRVLILLALTSILLYSLFAYGLHRTEVIKLVTIYAVLFFLFYQSVSLLKNNTKALTWLSFGFRFIFIFAIPNLSQDFYRFIWDGRMIYEGINPYLFTPDYFMQMGRFPIEEAKTLYNGMGPLSASHFTNYPPVNQLCFLIAALFAGKSILGSVVTMRLILIAADFGTLYFGKKLLEKLQIPTYHIFWYILNPFIIIELTGNLHFEGVMVFFLVCSLYLLHIGKWQLSALALTLSISVKLIPLIFIPLFYKWFVFKYSSSLKGLKKLLVFYLLIGLPTMLLFLPFYSSEFIKNYSETVGLWFRNFEFNASLYYIARGIGYTFRGYNEIAIIGKLLAALVMLFALFMALLRNNKSIAQLITAMLFVLSFYYFTATTVHPWYITTLLILSVFTKYRFPLVWSGVIILSYLAYSNTNDKENLWVIGIEYLVVYSFFIWEVFIKKATTKVAS